ncbi:MAG: glycoside hydrolase family 5 protein [Chitinophagales bacterium]|nr:glycoside hydrolase family 5 protein [Chitinophagales bacterium]
MRRILVLTICLIMSFSCKKEKGKDLPTYEPQSGNWKMGWIDVQQREFIDESGRFVNIRGINARVNGLFDVAHSDGRTPNEVVPEFTKDDVQMMAAWGFNTLRLPINWSGYEPERGVFDETYLNRIKEVVAWCKEVGIYVQLDWHFDAWSKEIGEDGAPYWAIIPGQSNYTVEGILNFNTLSLLRANPLVFKSYYSFFKNKEGILDEYFKCWTQIIEAFKDESAVIGFEPLNEPLAFGGGISPQEFMDFYITCSKKMRTIDQRHSLWLEPDALRNITDNSPLLDEPFPDKKIVYCPHYYPNLTQNLTAFEVPVWKRLIQKGLNRIQVEGKSWDAPVCINEWGINPKIIQGKTNIQAMREMMEDRYLHSEYWLWKEPRPGTSGGDGTWGFFNHLGGNNQWEVNEDAKKNAIVPYVMAMSGKYSYHRFDTDTRILTCKFAENGQLGNPIVYINPDWYPEGFNIFLNGELATFESDNYNRYGVVWTPGKGEYTLEVKPKG